MVENSEGVTVLTPPEVCVLRILCGERTWPSAPLATVQSTPIPWITRRLHTLSQDSWRFQLLPLRLDTCCCHPSCYHFLRCIGQAQDAIKPDAAGGAAAATEEKEETGSVTLWVP